MTINILNRSRHAAGTLCLTVLAIIFMVTLSTNTAYAQIDRAKQPAADPPPAAAFPSFDAFTLSNGLRVFLVHDQRPLVTFRFMFRGGDGEAPVVADAVADMMTRGAGGLSAQEFAGRIDFVGGNIGASADADALNVVAGGLKKHLPVILDLVSKAVMAPQFDAAELDKYKTEQITGLKSNKAESGFMATYAVQKVLFGNTYGEMPTEEAIARLSPAVLKSYHSARLTPSNATLAVVGDFTVPELKDLLEQRLKGWAGAGAQAPQNPQVAPLKNDPQLRIVIVDRPTSVQSAIRVLADGPAYNDPQRPMTTVLNSILGGGTGLGNRLAMNLRETHSYTYSPYSYFTANSVRGYFVAGADVRNSVTDSALKEMLYETDRMRAQPVSGDELQRNIQSAAGQFLMSVAKPDITASRVQFIDFYHLPADYYQKLVGVYNSTTAADVQRLAAKYLASQRISVVVVGKASEIRPGLEKLGSVEVWDADLNPVAAADMAAPAGDPLEAWNKMLTAMGGADKLRAVSSVKTTATVDLTAGPQSAAGTLTKLESAPNKRYVKLDLSVSQQETFCDGKNVTQVMNGYEKELTGDDLAKELENNHIMPEAYAASLGAKFALLPSRQFNGVKATVIQVTMPLAGATTYLIDPATNLPVGQETVKGAVVTFADWKAVDGVMLPFSTTIQPRPGIQLKMSDVKYTLNSNIPDTVFRPKH